MTSTASTYQVTKLASLPEAVPQGFRTCRIISKQSTEDKKAGKPREDSMGCFLPSVSSSFASTFASLHPEIVSYWIEQLQDSAVRKVWMASRRSPSESDLEISALVELFNSEEKPDRMTAAQIEAAMKSQLGLDFINYLAQSRGIQLVDQPENVAMLTQVRNNYIPFFQMAAARKPSFDSAAVKEKILSVLCGFGDWMAQNGKEESKILLAALEKMSDAPIKTVDIAGL